MPRTTGIHGLPALMFDQLWPIRQWRCEEIDCILRHGDDVLLHNSTVSIIYPSKHLHLWNKRIHRPIFGIRVLYANNGFPFASTHFLVYTEVIAASLSRNHTNRDNTRQFFFVGDDFQRMQCLWSASIATINRLGPGRFIFGSTVDNIDVT